ncbi:MAG TPA: ABC transporter ATP-binding protein [Syntrophobacteraceae bacterium]|nr:ABC transporter ATP-binding protein [Syntrophobacteraceae bacterium]
MIAIEDLEYRYPDGTLALQGITFSVNAGEFLVICGANGSGKTTLLRHLNGLLLPSRGSVKVAGLDTARHGSQARQLVGMVFQDADCQIVSETVAEDVGFGPENLGLTDSEVAIRVEASLSAMGIPHLARKPIHRLSGGEKRRVAIAGVLAMAPQVIVFDEPFANLDFAGVQQVLREILRLHHLGHTVVVTTHDLEKVIAHATRLAILFQGSLWALGAPQDLLDELPKVGMRPPCYAILGTRVLSWLNV